MAETVQDLNAPFADVYRALDLRQQRKAMKGAMRREGNRLKRQATASLSASGISQGSGGRALSRGIYTRVYPDRYGLGFMVSVKPHRGNNRKGIHINRHGRMKPVLMWAEDGTRPRRAGRRLSSFSSLSKISGKKVRNYIRGGHSTGRMKRYAFMAKAENQQGQAVESSLFATFQQNLDKAARKLGLT